MGRLIPKNNPKYDHRLDLDITIRASTAEATGALVKGLSQKNIEVEEQGADGLKLTGKSVVGVKNLWVTATFSGPPENLRVTSRITRAHTSAWIYLFFVGIGPRRVRGIKTYRTLTDLWRSNLAPLAVAEAGRSN